MPLAPLFIADHATMLKELRLSAVQSSEDASTIIDSAIERVRMQIYDQLGESRVATLKAIAYSPTATTENALLRTKANRLEVAWVRVYLLRDLPVLFMEAKGNAAQIWNEEGFTREADEDKIGKEIERLMAEILDWLRDISGTDDPALGTVGVTVIGQSSPVPAPGSSIFR